MVGKSGPTPTSQRLEENLHDAYETLCRAYQQSLRVHTNVRHNAGIHTQTHVTNIVNTVSSFWDVIFSSVGKGAKAFSGNVIGTAFYVGGHATGKFLENKKQAGQTEGNHLKETTSNTASSTQQHMRDLTEKQKALFSRLSQLWDASLVRQIFNG